jgi:hypothetical protein
MAAPVGTVQDGLRTGTTGAPRPDRAEMPGPDLADVSKADLAAASSPAADTPATATITVRRLIPVPCRRPEGTPSAAGWPSFR